MLKKFLRYFAMTIIAMTGIGLFYLLAKTRVIRDGYRGVVYNQGKLEILEPGIHVLLSPLSIFDQEVSVKNEIVALNKFEIKTSDNVPTLIQADLSYQISDLNKATVNVSNFHRSILEQARAGLAAMLRDYSYQDLSSSHVDTDHGQTSRLSQLRDTFLNQLRATCAEWGVEIKSLRIVSVEAQDRTTSEALAQAALSHVQAEAKKRAAAANAEAAVLEAQGNARVTQIGAEATAEALGIRVVATLKAAQTLGVAPSQLLQLQNNVDVADKFSRTTGTVMLGATCSLFPQQTTGLAVHQAPVQKLVSNQHQSRPRSLSAN